jgi:hypothetical protein
MRPADLRSLLRKVPFLPFRLHLTNGTVFEVRHPERAVVGRSTVVLSLPPESSLEREAIIALIHIMWIETQVPSP